MLDVESYVNDKDLGTVRIVDLGNNKIRVTREDPYGLWHISFEKGVMPGNLKGAYTSPDLALLDVEKYINDKKRVVKE